MRRTGIPPHRPMTGTGSTSFQETNPEVWVQLGEEPHNTNIEILETVQKLKGEMARLRADNERLMQEQEKVMKSLSDRQNQQKPTPNSEHENIIGKQSFRTKNVEIEGDKENHEEESDNVSKHKTQKR